MEKLDSLLFNCLILVVVFTAIPLGSNQLWSWSLAGVCIAGLCSLFLLRCLLWRKAMALDLHWSIPLAFLLALGWAALQAWSGTPASWHHPVWQLVAGILQQPVETTISIAPQDTLNAALRTLGYGLAFFLAFQLGKNNQIARRGLLLLFIAGTLLSVYGLLSYFGVLREFMWYADDSFGRDVRATFVNRNHFATWAGLVLLCGLGYFFNRWLAVPDYPMLSLQRRQEKINRFLAISWLPLVGLVLVLSALVSSHSRGGFAAAFIAGVIFLLIVDRKRKRVSTRARIVIATVLGLGAMAFWISSDILLQRYGASGIDATGRTQVYSKTLEAISDNPLLGYGHGNFEDAFRLYRTEDISKLVNYAHNSYLESLFDLGIPASLLLIFAILGLGLTCLNGVRIRKRDWILPAVGLSATVLVGIHSLVDFSLQIPAVAFLYSCIMGIACAQSFSSQHLSSRQQAGSR